MIRINKGYRAALVKGAQAGLLAGLVINPTHAVEFNLGEVEGNFSSQLSIGASWRAEDPDKALISPGNVAGATGSSSVTDDGNLNFKKGDAFSKIFKGIHDLELTYQNYGAFFRGKYWYDYELANNGKPHGHSPNGYTAGAELDDSGFADFAKFSGIELLDAFVYGNLELGDMPLDLRLGRQVVSWGESTFIQNGVNSINPIDVSAFRRPGAEVKEGLLPVSLLYGNLGVSDALSVEAFYQLDWQSFVIDGCGTYFSNADIVAAGCNVGTLSVALPDKTQLAVPAASLPRFGNREPDSNGQYGVALRYVSEELNETEFGIYYQNLHSRIPIIAPIKTASGGLGGYFIDYPEDVSQYGVSFNTNVGTWSVSGEYSYRPDQPLQVNTIDILRAGFGVPTTYSSTFNAAAPGRVNGHDTVGVSQAQVTVVKFLDQVAGASRVTLIGEAGANYVHDLPDASERAYGRSPVFGGAEKGSDGYVTSTSWGYRARAVFDYPNALYGINLKPTIAWSHDVSGFSPNANFREGRKALGLSLNADYLSKYTGGISYNSFFGGDFHDTNDRDFISINFGMSF